MNLRILDTELNASAIVDSHESFTWTDRYNLCGDFELYLPVDDFALANLKKDYYIERKDSEHVMIIEDFLIETDEEDGNHLTITGRSLESILDRRIIWGLKTLSGNLQNGVETLLNECIINPSNPDRKIDNFIFEASDDPAITELTIDAQFTGDNLYDTICAICQVYGIGFKITLNNLKQFVFTLYAGSDRSYEQTSNPYVIFSPQFDNLMNSNYVESNSSAKNVTLVGGEGEGVNRKYATTGSGVGLNRREMFTDARDISSDDVPTGSTYESLLIQRGNERLVENARATAFEGEAETSVNYVYGVDFFNGDIVQIANEYGHEARVRIVEMITSEDESGVHTYPTFETITEEGEQDT